MHSRRVAWTLPSRRAPFGAGRTGRQTRALYVLDGIRTLPTQPRAQGGSFAPQAGRAAKRPSHTLHTPRAKRCLCILARKGANGADTSGGCRGMNGRPASPYGQARWTIRPFIGKVRGVNMFLCERVLPQKTGNGSRELLAFRKS